MEHISTKTTYLVELTSTEHEALRILSKCIKKRASYAGGEQFYVELMAMIGKTYAKTIEKMFEED